MERFIRKLFGLTFSALLAVVMLFSSVTVFAEEYDSKYPSENVNIAKTRAEMFLNSVGKPALLEEGILLKNLNGEYEAVSFSMPENGYIIVNIKDLTIPELSFENSNPYDNVKNPIYNGVLSYYSKVGEEFVYLKDNSSVRIEQFENVYSKEEIADKEESIRTLENTLKNQLRHEKDKGWQYLIKIEKKGGEITLISFMDNKVKVNDIVYEVRDYNIDDFSYLFE